MCPILRLVLALLLSSVGFAAPLPYAAEHARVRSLLEAGQAARALETVEAALKKHPKAEPLHRLAGISAFRLLKLERARAAFEAAISLEPKIAFNYLKLASLELCERKDRAAAERALERLWAELPGDLESRREAAEMYAACGDADRAIALYLALARLDPKEGWLHRFHAGRLYHAAGRYRDALVLLRRAESDGPPEKAELPAQLGATLARMGDRAAAAEAYRRALGRRPDTKLRERLLRELEGLR